MSAHHLPANPNLTNLRNQAKQLLKDHSAGDSETWARWRRLPKLANLTGPEVQSAPVSLADAQSVIARESGFVSWRHLKRHIEMPEELKELGRAIEAFDGERARQLLKRSPELVHVRLYNSDAEEGTTVLGYAVWVDRKETSHITPLDIALGIDTPMGKRVVKLLFEHGAEGKEGN